MASDNYLTKRRKAISDRNAIRGELGNKTIRKNMMERGQDLKVVGGFTTWGSMGEHVIEVLACDDPSHAWIRVDGWLRQPRTMRGLHSVLSRWVYKTRTKGK